VRFLASYTAWFGLVLSLDITLRGLVFGVLLDLTLEGGVDRLPRNFGNHLPSYSSKHDGRLKAVREFRGILIQFVFRHSENVTVKVFFSVPQKSKSG
jgi:hypothetical protein